jgi:hypothetical protein
MKDNIEIEIEKTHAELLKEFKSYQDSQFEYLRNLWSMHYTSNIRFKDTPSPWYINLWKKIVYIFHKYISYQ